MREDVRKVLRRALVDEEFLDAMSTDPRTALQDYDLTDEERSALERPDRDLIELMRIGGENAQAVPLLFLDITLVIDLTEFITSLHLDITIDLTAPEVQRRQEQNRERVAQLAQTVRSMRAGADRLEQLQEMLQTLSGATELAMRRPEERPDRTTGAAE